MAAANIPTAPITADPEDDAYAIALQLEEIHSFTSAGKGKYSEDNPPDSAPAMQDYKTALERLLLLFDNRRFAQSIDKVVADDTIALTDFGTIGNQALYYGAISRSLGKTLPQTRTQEISENLGKLQLNSSTQEVVLYTDLASRADKGEVAGPSRSWQERQQQSLLKSSTSLTTECVACREIFHSKELLKSPCNDSYCAECLKSLFIRATKDETLFPPRCCGQVIPLSLVEERLSFEAFLAFKSATIEFTTTNRTYCASKNCGIFILPCNIHSDRATCTDCNKATCVYCKEPFHNGDCPKDEALQEMLMLAEGKKWRRCFSCKMMVELNGGCIHITCKCSAQFCYLCGVQWKRCNCDTWDDEHLLNEAEEDVDYELAMRVAAPEFRQQVPQMRHVLLARHECDYEGRWEREEGDGITSFTCELCHTRHRRFILWCPQCHLRACAECKMYRI